MNLSKYFSSLIAIALMLALSSCGPIYRTQYTFVPPEQPVGKTCVFQCDNSKLQCQQLQDMQQERCEDRSERAYERCQDRNEDREAEGKKARYCHREYCSVEYERCDTQYRSCYQSCGGAVHSKEVCVSFCDQT